MKIGIIGNGYVGNAIVEFFKDRADLAVYDLDPEKSFCSSGFPLEDHSEYFEAAAASDYIFVCVGTPTVDGKIDLYAVEDVMNGLLWEKVKNPIILKSTVVPGTCQDLFDNYGLNITYNPEFLTARTAVQDFAQPDSIVLAGPNLDPVLELYAKFFPDMRPHCFPQYETAELIKYARNTFYATKVAFWNEIKDVADELDVDYGDVLEGVLASGWIDPMHCNVPGPDGQRGYGGACLPKDSQALIATARKLGKPMLILEAVDESNKKYRSDAV